MGVRAIWLHHAGYMHCKIEKFKVSIHRMVWIFEKGPIPRRLMVDHKNRNKLDNRLCNLRLASAAQNAANNKGRGRKYRGVYKLPSGRYRAIVRSARTEINCGVFETEIEAAKAYNKFAKRRLKQFAVLNEV